MKNKAKTMTCISIALLTVSAISPASATEWFVGAALGKQTNNIDVDYIIGSDARFGTRKSTDNLYELRSGIISGNSHRLSGVLAYNSVDILKRKYALASYDYLINIGDTNLKWFVGGSAGVERLDSKLEAKHKNTEFIWGVQTGALYEINDSFSLEVGYRYLSQDSSFKETDGDDYYEVKVKQSDALYLAASYHF